MCSYRDVLPALHHVFVDGSGAARGRWHASSTVDHGSRLHPSHKKNGNAFFREYRYDSCTLDVKLTLGLPLCAFALHFTDYEL